MNAPPTPSVPTPKPFDCVEMKRRVQEELVARQAGQSREALNAAAERSIATDPHLRRLLESTSKPVAGRGAG